MKALFTLESAINTSTTLAVGAILLVLPYIYPAIALAAQPQTLQGNNDALVFKIKSSEGLVQTLNNPSIAYQQTVQDDPLVINLHNYLVSYNSPLADYTTQLVNLDNWKTVVAISYVESNMCLHDYYYNCSGIGGQQYLQKYHNYGEWITAMSTLLDNHYNGWTLEQMDGTYVQPYSPNWRLGSERILAELNQLQQLSDQQRAALAQNSDTPVYAALSGTPLLADLK